MSREALQKLRQRYPGYDDLSDADLAAKIVAKYPEYRDLLGGLTTPAGVGTLPVESAPFHARERAKMLGEHPLAATTLQTAATTTRYVAPAAAGFMTGPVGTGLVAAGAEGLAQTLEQPLGREGYDPTAIGIAGVAPVAGAVTGRAARALGRTAVRTIPPLFEFSQRRAQQGFGAMVEGFRPPGGAASAAFQGARQTGGTVSMQPLAGLLDDVDRALRRSPTSGEQKVARELVDGLRQELQAGGGVFSLDDLDALRRDLNGLISRGQGGSAVEAIQKGVLLSLDAAARTGGSGAAQLKEALLLYKRDLGATKLAALLEKPGVLKDSALGGKQLNIAQLGRAVRQNSEEFKRLLGPGGLEVVEGFLEKFRSLPPTQAYTGWNTLVNGVLGGAAAVGGAMGGAGMVAPAAGAVALTEVLRNLMGVGRNPALLNQAMNLIVLGSRASLATRTAQEDR